MNVSPRGLHPLRILSDTRVIWLNLAGSGNETATHLRESDRMNLMFCAFEGDARILRPHGRTRAIHPRDEEWEELSGHSSKMAGTRQVIDIMVDTFQISCGSGVPSMAFEKGRGEEEILPYWDKMGPECVRAYWHKPNTQSLDGKDTGIVDETCRESAATHRPGLRTLTSWNR